MSSAKVLYEKGVLRNCTKFTENRRPAILIKKRPRHKCFPVNFVIFIM